MALALQLTTAGLAAVRAPAGTQKTVIAKLGLTAQPFIVAPTLTALPGEFKRLDILSGVAAAPTVAHITAYDTSADTWSATGFGLFLEDDTLFASFSASEPVLSKAGVAFALMAFDIAFNADVLPDIAFGDATFVWPPSTETARGVAELATQGEVDDGQDDQRIVTPLKLKKRLAAVLASVDTAISTLVRRSVKAGGLATGGGDLSQDRTITVTEASAAQVGEGTDDKTVITPRRLGPIAMLLQQNGFIRFFGVQLAWGRFTATANASTPVAFAQAFPSACFSVVVSGVVGTGIDSQDNTPAVVASTITKAGFSAFSADDSSDVTCYIAVGY